MTDLSTISKLSELLFKTRFKRQGSGRRNLEPFFRNERDFSRLFGAIGPKILKERGEVYDTKIRTGALKAIRNSRPLSEVQYQVLRSVVAHRADNGDLSLDGVKIEASFLDHFDRLAAPIKSPRRVDHLSIYRFALAGALPVTGGGVNGFMNPQKAAAAADFLEAAQKLTQPVRNYLLKGIRPSNGNGHGNGHGKLSELVILAFLGTDRNVANAAASIVRENLTDRNFRTLAKKMDEASRFVEAGKKLTARERASLLASRPDKHEVLIETLRAIAQTPTPAR